MAMIEAQAREAMTPTSMTTASGQLSRTSASTASLISETAASRAFAAQLALAWVPAKTRERGFQRVRTAWASRLRAHRPQHVPCGAGACRRTSTGAAKGIGVVIPELLEDAIRVELAKQVLVYADA
jgi:hypothetical protein